MTSVGQRKAAVAALWSALASAWQHLPPERQLRRGAEGGCEPSLHHRIGNAGNTASLNRRNPYLPAFGGAEFRGRV
jgi:hypothetical protein